MKLYWTTDLAAWDDLARPCPGTTWFHRGAWLGAVAEAIGGRFEGAILAKPDGAVGLVPIVRRPAPGGLWQQGFSGGPLGGYGGLIAPTPWTAAEVDAAFRLLGRFLPDMQAAGNPFSAHPHLPTGDQTPMSGAVVTLDGPRPLPPLGPDQDVYWTPGPQEFQADMFGHLESPEAARPRAFYYHLFRLSCEETLAMLLLRERGCPVAGALVGLDGDTATLLGVVGPRGHQATLFGHLTGRLGPTVRRLDLGPGLRWPETLGGTMMPTSWTAWRRCCAPTRWMTRLRRSDRRVS